MKADCLFIGGSSEGMQKVELVDGIAPASVTKRSKYGPGGLQTYNLMDVLLADTQEVKMYVWSTMDTNQVWVRICTVFRVYSRIDVNHAPPRRQRG